MSDSESLMAAEDEAFVRMTMRLLFVWTIVVVAAGVALVLLQGVFAGIFT